MIKLSLVTAINKSSGRNSTQGTNYSLQEKSSWTDTQFNPNKLVNVRWYIIKSNHLRDAEKDNIKEKVVVDIQRNESVELEMNAINNETNKTLKQSNNHWMKTPAIENEYNKLEKRKPQNSTENKIKTKYNQRTR